MKITQSVLCALAVGISCGFADEIQLLDGRIYKNAVITRKNADFVHIEHEDGIAKVSVSKLSEDFKEELGLTPQQVAGREHERMVQEERANQKAKELRDSLSESEKVPDYIDSDEALSRFWLPGKNHPSEAKYLALQHNLNEAKRVGLRDDEKSFANQMKPLAAEIQKINDKRRIAAEQSAKREKSEQVPQQPEPKYAGYEPKSRVAQLMERAQPLSGQGRRVGTGVRRSTSRDSSAVSYSGNASVNYEGPVVYNTTYIRVSEPQPKPMPQASSGLYGNPSTSVNVQPGKVIVVPTRSR